jgi:hypothetical protein
MPKKVRDGGEARSPAHEARSLPRETENPTYFHMPGFQFWRRPTLARPVAVLPSGLQRFTAVFGMGTGGATALLSPEVRAGLALEPHWRFRSSRSDASADVDLWGLIGV